MPTPTENLLKKLDVLILAAREFRTEAEQTFGSRPSPEDRQVLIGAQHVIDHLDLTANALVVTGYNIGDLVWKAEDAE